MKRLKSLGLLSAIIATLTLTQSCGTVKKKKVETKQTEYTLERDEIVREVNKQITLLEDSLSKVKQTDITVREQKGDLKRVDTEVKHGVQEIETEDGQKIILMLDSLSNRLSFFVNTPNIVTYEDRSSEKENRGTKQTDTITNNKETKVTEGTELKEDSYLKEDKERRLTPTTRVIIFIILSIIIVVIYKKIRKIKI